MNDKATFENCEFRGDDDPALSLSETLEKQRIERAEHMAKLQDRKPVGIDNAPYVLYTYEAVKATGSTICHAYTNNKDGSSLTKDQAVAASEKLHVANPGMGMMVLPAEVLPI